MIGPAVKLFRPLVPRTALFAPQLLAFKTADPMPKQAMQATDKHAAQRGRRRRILLRIFESELGDALSATPRQRRLLGNSTTATSIDTFSAVKPALLGPKLTLLRAAISAIAITVTFVVIVLVTAWYGPDCRSPQRSISIGNAVLVAGCLQNSSHFGRGP